jgi:hypothetical protein
MSNIGRPRTGLKPCPHCKSKDRDSNGQCHCRNVLYRALRGASKATAAKAKAHYDAALSRFKGKVDRALADTREEYPSLAAKVRKAPAKAPKPGKGKARKAAEASADVAARTKQAEREAAAEAQAAAPVEHAVKPVVDDSFDGDKYECLCGFQGKNSLPSIRAHVAREKKAAEQAA